MSNTSDTLGIQTTLDKLIAHELESFEEDTVIKLRDYAFDSNVGIKLVSLPNCNTIGTYALARCSELTTVDLSQQLSLVNSAFVLSTALRHLILRSATLCPLSTLFSYVFNYTKIAIGEGAIYVPSNLVEVYKSATNWSAAADRIYALEDYPVTDFGTIKDSWDTIITKLANGTADYVVGDTKIMDYDGTPVYMQLVALDTDDLADGSGKAKSTWISKSILELKKMNESGKSDWANSDLRAYMRSTVINKIPSNVRNAIKEASKTYRSATGETLSIVDTVWVPSVRELGVTESTYIKIESQGVIYSDVFTSDNKRIKFDSTNMAGSWWSRSVQHTDTFELIANSGGASWQSSTSTAGLVLGFCI